MKGKERTEKGGKEEFESRGEESEKGVRRKAVVLQPSVVCSPAAAAAAEQKKVKSVRIYPLAAHHRPAVGPVSAPLSPCVCVHYVASVDPRHELLC